eukprot:CAMPEP_0198287112 /NCGR_PEP_ID=MMETSP1449-20131203/6028_1 /TAXON_ID=420275 /ORGANISM="Attheya septentrionalis, Strain CCMP2084" /LENGTH=110 /DNA_ID=CAMNT_0043985015 /DNA_START=196 /DNA_END=528 /DNA_ORIENTATION=+
MAHVPSGVSADGSSFYNETDIEENDRKKKRVKIKLIPVGEKLLVQPSDNYTGPAIMFKRNVEGFKCLHKPNLGVDNVGPCCDLIIRLNESNKSITNIQTFRNNAKTHSLI